MKYIIICCVVMALFSTAGCSTDTANSPALAPLTSSANDLFNSEVSEVNDFAYQKGANL